MEPKKLVKKVAPSGKVTASGTIKDGKDGPVLAEMARESEVVSRTSYEDGHPWGAVTVGVDAKLSQSFQSIGVSVSITLPVPNMTDLAVAKRAVIETKAMLDSQLADFVVELKEALPALAKK